MMDGFNLIQNFFARMTCNQCEKHLEPEGIELIRHDDDVYIVNVECVHCEHQMGMAMVGLEGAELSDTLPEEPFEHYELTEDDFERLKDYQRIGYDDVVEAHRFFQNLDEDWMKFIPQEMRQWKKAS